MSSLANKLAQINWNDNTAEAAKEEDLFCEAQKQLKLLALWCKQLENIYRNNPALPFIREAQVSTQDLCCLISLGIYKCSASSLRTLLESMLYFSYFKDHPVELKSLVTVKPYYLSKKDILDYHLVHTEHFNRKYKAISLNDKLEAVYSEISAIVHGQMPGAWHSSGSLTDKKFNKQLATLVVEQLTKTMQVINPFLLILINDDEWRNIDHNVQKVFLSGMSQPTKQAIGKH